MKNTQFLEDRPRRTILRPFIASEGSRVRWAETREGVPSSGTVLAISESGMNALVECDGGGRRWKQRTELDAA